MRQLLEPPDVVVTRERGKNDKLIAELQQRGVNVLELPLVESTAGPDRYTALSFMSGGGASAPQH